MREGAAESSLNDLWGAVLSRSLGIGDTGGRESHTPWCPQGRQLV
jgi:hypothetical protein